MKCGAFIPPYVLATLLAAACRTAADPPPPPAAPAPAATPAPPAAPTTASEAISFETSVKPLLARTCTPCHVPGGRMYERMPFDRPETLLSHKDGVLRRLKNPDDHQLMERWFAEQDKS
jgi:hypothetical protein